MANMWFDELCFLSRWMLNILIELWAAFCVAQMKYWSLDQQRAVLPHAALFFMAIEIENWDQLSKIDHEILWDLIKHKKMIYYNDQFDIPIQTSVVSC